MYGYRCKLLAAACLLTFILLSVVVVIRNHPFDDVRPSYSPPINDVIGQEKSFLQVVLEQRNDLSRQLNQLQVRIKSISVYVSDKCISQDVFDDT